MQLRITDLLNLLLTGATGFLGKHLLAQLSGFNTKVMLRSESDGFTNSAIISCFNGDTDFSGAVFKQDVIIHCAARVHLMSDTSLDPLKEFREVNTYGTLNLAKQAASSGVKRFIFISSIKVNGESTKLGHPFRPDDIFTPTDPYGLSKYEAEVGLRKIAKETGIDVVIIRPPLVYGPCVKGNFASLLKWVNNGIPLPFGGVINNKRSLVSVDNLVDLIITCIEHPKAANQTFLVSDDEDVSTAGLLNNMAEALNAPSRLVPIPVSWFDFSCKLIGKPELYQRLCGSLEVDIAKTKELLNWHSRYSSADSMKKTAASFVKNLNKKDNYE